MNHLKSFFSVVKESKNSPDNGEKMTYDDLVNFLTKLGIIVFEEQIQMKNFIEQFGSDKDPEEWVEYLFDYYHHPFEFDIEEDSEYYEMICQFYDYSVEPHKRFNLHGSAMRIGQYQRFDLDDIEKTPEYRLYKTMSEKLGKRKIS